MDFQSMTAHETGSLRSKLDLAKTNISELSAWQAKNQQEQALEYCLQRAADLAEGCLLVAANGLLHSLPTLLRSLYEVFLQTYWIAISNENAQKFADNSLHLLKKIIAKNLRDGYAQVLDPQTGQNATQEFLDHPDMQNIPRLLEFKALADECGLERIHTNLYGILSMLSHGNQFGASPVASPEELVALSIASANALLATTRQIVIDRLQENKLTSVEELYALFRLPLRLPSEGEG